VTQIPQDAQLNLVLNLAKEPRGDLPKNPLARMDLFYDLIMLQIPSDAVSIVQKILLSDMMDFGCFLFFDVWPLFDNIASLSVSRLGNILGLSQEVFYSSCGFLQSVLFLAPDENEDSTERIHYYHLWNI